MNKQPMRASGLVAAGVVAGGILVGTLGAHAADEASDANRQTIAFHDHLGPGGPPGPAFGPAGGADLAKELGVSKAQLRKAFREIRDDLRPSDGERPAGPPSDAQREEIKARFVAALAKELNVSEAKVTAALDKLQKAHEAKHRDALSDRLDAAVKAGTLTDDDKASVLKAFDAGVLGGPGPR